jgi:hypothetical protein
MCNELWVLDMRGDGLTMGYFDNIIDNGPLNKYKNILKMKKNYRCVLLPMD